MNLNSFFNPKEKPVTLLCFFFLLIASVFSVGYHHFDEHFQILEFAAAKLGMASPANMPWEYHAQMRPAIQPAIVVGLYKLFDLFGTANPFTIAFITRLLSALLSFCAMRMIYNVYKNQIKNDVLNKWFTILSFLLWFALYNGVRFSSENWSGQFFIIAFSLFFLLKNKSFFSFFCVGLVLGAAFLFRYQVGFLIAGFLLWVLFIKKEKFSSFLSIVIGILFVVLLGVLIDKWFYGAWTLSTWNYFKQNLLEGHLSSFGVSPWWQYFKDLFLEAVPPFSLLFIVSILAVIIFKPKNVITWTIFPFLLVHFMLGHKELRFLFPIIGLLPVIVIQAFEVIQEIIKKDIISSKITKWCMKIFFIANFILILFVILQPADNQISLYKTVYEKYPQPTNFYYVNQNPYNRAIEIKFYTRRNLTVKKMEGDIQNLPKGSLVAFLIKDRQAEFEKKNKRIYSSFPQWVERYNYNNWMKRTDMWLVYEVIE